MSTAISQKIINKVDQISAVAHLLPGAIIIHDLRDFSVVWMCPRGLKVLGVTLNDIAGKTSKEYHHLFFNTEDAEDYVPKIQRLLEENNDEILTFFQQVRAASQTDFTWHISSIKILERTDDGLPLLGITMAFPIDAMHQMTSKAGRLLEENNFLRKHSQQFAKLSEREREILSHVALGKSSSDSAKELFLSKNTVETHRKNIRQKLETNSFFELCQYARAFDLV